MHIPTNAEFLEMLMENLPGIIISATAVIVAALLGAIGSAFYNGGKTYKTTKIAKAELSTEHAGLSKEYSEKQGALSKEHATLLGQYAVLAKGQESIATATNFLYGEAIRADERKQNARDGALDAITIMEKLGGISAELIALQEENAELRTENRELRQAMRRLQTEYQKLEEHCQELETELGKESNQEEWGR